MKAAFKVTNVNFNDKHQVYEVSIETTNFAKKLQDFVIVDKNGEANPAQVSELFPLARMSSEEIRDVIDLAETAVISAL